MAVDAEVQALVDEATSVLKVMQRQARRALVLELTGTPKAGKTTSVTTLKAFFKECGYRVHLLKERAADCPLPMKGHFFFNTWTTCTMIAEVLETVDTPVDLIILDRGFFDALVWLELQSKRGQVTSEEKDAFSKFVTLRRWRSLVDAVVVMSVAPATAMKRENTNLIVPRSGSIMKEEPLSEFNAALASVAEKYRNEFDVITFDSTEGGVIESNKALLKVLLPKLRSWADPNIVAVPRDVLKGAYGPRAVLKAKEAREAWDLLRPHLRVGARSSFERDPGWVQMTACGVATHAGALFVFERSGRDKKSQEYGKQVLWKGCHVEASEAPDLKMAADCLVRRIHQDLHLAIPLAPDLLGLVWDEANEANHVGFMFKVPIELEDVARSMKEKEFRNSGRYHTSTATFQKPAALAAAGADFDLEPWSVSLLTEIGVSP